MTQWIASDRGDDELCFAAAIERSFHVVLRSFSPSPESQESLLESRASRKLCFDARRSNPAMMANSFGGLSGADVCRFPSLYV
jgi:hypothetical protein